MQVQAILALPLTARKRSKRESLRHGTRKGTLEGLAVTGGVITSAGVVLAGTFSALGVLPLVPFAELGFAVAFGVLLDTLIVLAAGAGSGARHRRPGLVARRSAP